MQAYFSMLSAINWTSIVCRYLAPRPNEEKFIHMRIKDWKFWQTFHSAPYYASHILPCPCSKLIPMKNSSTETNAAQHETWNDRGWHETCMKRLFSCTNKRLVQLYFKYMSVLRSEVPKVKLESVTSSHLKQSFLQCVLTLAGKRHSLIRAVWFQLLAGPGSHWCIQWSIPLGRWCQGRRNDDNLWANCVV